MSTTALRAKILFHVSTICSPSTKVKLSLVFDNLKKEFRLVSSVPEKKLD